MQTDKHTPNQTHTHTCSLGLFLLHVARMLANLGSPLGVLLYQVDHKLLLKLPQHTTCPTSQHSNNATCSRQFPFISIAREFPHRICAKLVKVESWKIEFKLSRSSQFHLRFNYKMKSWQSWEGIKVLTTLLLIHLLSFCRAMQVNRELRTVSNLILLPTFGSLRKNLKYGKWIWR